MPSKKTSNRTANRLLRLLLQQGRDQALIILDTEGRIVSWLAGSHNVFGYEVEEVLGKHFRMLFIPEDRELEAPERELRIGASGSSAQDDRWMLRKDGVRFWATGVLQPIFDENGAIFGYGKSLRNRTDLKAQFELLETAIEEFRTADSHKNHFISTLAHELRNPLQSLTNALRLIRKVVSQTAEGVFAIAVIERQLDLMRRLVDDLLEITRLTNGKVRLQIDEISLNEVLLEAIEACGGVLEKRPRKLHAILGDVSLYVRADAVRLRQVFVNLIENAAKFTEDGGDIWVKLLVEEKDAVVAIEDNGIGISPDVLPRIFELFTQADTPKDRNPEGLGIGLSVVREIVALHGGSVQVRSHGLGKGSEFLVRLPAFLKPTIERSQST